MVAAAPVATVKRLQHDLREVLEDPLPHVVAMPLEDDLLIWHGNVRGDPQQWDHPFADVPFHFLLLFPKDYPTKAPEVLLYTNFPHPNVRRSHAPQRGAPFRLSLFDCLPGHDAWSCGFTVHSILVQLQQFLLDDDLMWDTSRITPQQTAAHALQVKVEECGHSGSAPNPPFLSSEELQAAQRGRAKVAVAAPNRRVHRRTAALPAITAPKADVPPTVAAKGKASPGAAPPAAAQAGSEVSGKHDAEDEWVEVKGKRRNLSTSGPAQGAASSSLAAARPVADPNCFSLLSNAASALEAQHAATSTTGSAHGSSIAGSVGTSAVGSNSATGKAGPSKSAKKNLRRSQKRAAAGAQPLSASSGAPSSVPAPAASAPPVVETSITPQGTVDGWQDIKSKKPAAAVNAQTVKTQRELIKDVLDSVTVGRSLLEADIQQCERSSDLSMPMGSFDVLPADILASILSLLTGKDLVRLGSACKGLLAACSEGEVWQAMMQRDYPASQITASRACDWKHAYMLQSNNIVGELQCYYSKASFEDEVLGMPLRWTVNPRTGALDYIHAEAELLSMAAFQQGVRETPQHQQVMAVLPAYLTEEHFERALPRMPKLLRGLLPEKPGNQVTADGWLDALPKILNTAIVLIVDKGNAVSDSALSTYCSVNRLLLALAEHHSLWSSATARLDRFLRHESMRNKAACPNLGMLLPLIGLSSKHSWKDCVLPVLEEQFARSILWLCKAFPDMAARLSCSPHIKGADEELNAKAFESMKVARRLLAFNFAFLTLVAKPPNTTLDQVIEAQDVLYGRPGPGLQQRMKAAIGSIMGMQSWDDFFQLVGVRLNLPTAQMVTKLLRRGWMASLRKGYHNKGMDFSRVQASGVSRLLLRGETYSAPPNMRRIEMEVHYRWVPINIGNEMGVRYLDGACLLYGSGARFIEAVAWDTRCSFGTQRPGAVTHSGDIMDFPNSAGKNTCSIRLDDLGHNVVELYWTLSAWSISMLTDLKQPYVSVVDPKTGESLCEFHLEEQPQEVLRRHKAVVMCRFFRGSRTGLWEVEAIGNLLPSGDTANYQPIVEHIAGLIHARGPVQL